MNFEIQGSIKIISDTQTFPSGFTKREFVVTTDQERFPQDLKLEFVKDKCTTLDRFKVGQRVKVNFDIRGSEYNGKYFVNLSAWKVGPADGDGGGGGSESEYDQQASAPARNSGGGGGGGAPKRTGPTEPPPPSYDYGDGDDMPF